MCSLFLESIVCITNEVPFSQSFTKRKLAKQWQSLKLHQWLLLGLLVMSKHPVASARSVLFGPSIWMRRSRGDSTRIGASPRRRLSLNIQKSTKLMKGKRTFRHNWRKWRSTVQWFVFWLIPRYFTFAELFGILWAGYIVIRLWRCLDLCYMSSSKCIKYPCPTHLTLQCL